LVAVDRRSSQHWECSAMADALLVVLVLALFGLLLLVAKGVERL
jgi:hypothetical protein